MKGPMTFLEHLTRCSFRKTKAVKDQKKKGFWGTFVVIPFSRLYSSEKEMAFIYQ